MKHKAKARSLNVAFIMDAMNKLLIEADTSISIMMEIQRRGHHVFYIEPHELIYENGSVFADARKVIASSKHGFKIISKKRWDLRSFDVIFNRKEPPFDIQYLYLTQLLEVVEPNVFVINSPQGVRKANEKLYILEFPEWIPKTMVSNNAQEIENFRMKLKNDLVLKQLDQKGGQGIELLRWKENHASTTIRKMTEGGKKWIMAQRFLKRDLIEGDKRILLLNGEVLGQYQKIPKKGEFRANLSLGAKFVKTTLNQKDKKLVRDLRPKLIRDGLYFVGIDVVDGKLIEINVTSPAGIPEINELEQARPEVRLVDFLEEQALSRKS